MLRSFKTGALQKQPRRKRRTFWSAVFCLTSASAGEQFRPQTSAQGYPVLSETSVRAYLERSLPVLQVRGVTMPT